MFDQNHENAQHVDENLHQMDSHASKMGSPITLLPEELLSYIFTLTLPSHGYYSYSSATGDKAPLHSFSPSASPLLLTHVSQHWRNVATSHGSLWSLIRIPSPSMQTKSQAAPKGLVQLVELWILRSGEAGIAVEIASSAEDDIIEINNLQEQRKAKEEYTIILSEILALLRPHRHRIHVFRAVMPERLAHEAGVDEMDSLRALELELSVGGMLGASEEWEDPGPGFTWHSWQDGDWEVINTSPAPENEDEPVEEGGGVEVEEGQSERRRRRRIVLPNAHSSSSTIRHVAISRFPVDLKSLALHQSLVHLELISSTRSDPADGISQHDAFLLLRTFPLLTSCILDISADDYDTLHRDRMITGDAFHRLVLYSLQTLFVTWSFPADISTLLDSIQAPNLRNLGLRGTPLLPLEASRWPNLRYFLEASAPPLERLSLGDMGQTNIQLLSCLKQCPTLLHLTLNHCTIDDLEFEMLTMPTQEDTEETRNPEEVYIPRLEVISLGVCEGFSPEALIAFARSRSDLDNRTKEMGATSLQEVTILYCPSVRAKHEEEIRAMSFESLLLEIVDDGAIFPYARVVETHRELLAVVYASDDED